jgi:hypothetical protein
MPLRILISAVQFRQLKAGQPVTYWILGQAVEIMLSENVPLIGDDPPQAREFLPRLG